MTSHASSSRRAFVGSGLLGAGLALSPRLRHWWPSGRAERLTILHTTDLHAQIDAHDEFFWEDGKAVFKKRGGFATLRTLIRSVRRENPGTVLVVDGGDCIQGSGIAALSQGRVIVDLINQMGYDLVLPGNWEVLYGKAKLLENLRRYTAAKVCANMFHANRPNQLLFPAFKVLRVGGLKIGFIGYTDPLTPIRQSPAYSRGIRFEAPEVSLAKHVKFLREQQRCSLVFLLTHLGLTQQLNLADQAECQGVDYILGGDTHERVREPIPRKFAKVTEPGAFGSFVGRLDLVVENGKITSERYNLLDVDPDRYREDDNIKAAVRKAKEPYQSQLNKVIGRTSTPLYRYLIVETPMDNLITDALMWRFGTDLVVSNGFRFCPPLVPGANGMAEITRDYLWNMLPVNSEVKRADVTGRQIQDWLEVELENVFAKDALKRFGGWFVRFKGMQVTFRARGTTGSRLEQVTIGKRPLDPKAQYSMLACEREGDPDTVLCRMKNVQKGRRVNVLLHDVVMGYLAKHSPVAPVVEGRAVAMDEPGQLLSQVEGTTYRFR